MDNQDQTKGENPKLFLSYSWSNKEHEAWVINLAEALVENGIDVILDKWDLKEGQDALFFMEKMVVDPCIKKVIIVSDKIYAEKANSRKGGVGTETQIISPEIYNKAEQNKFVVVISEKDENGEPYLPLYYKSRIFIDLSDDERYATNFEQLLRWMYDKPLYIKPPLGSIPTHLTPQENGVSLGTSLKYSSAINAIQLNVDRSKNRIDEYLTTLVSNLEEFRINPETKGVEFDELMIKNIDQFIPYRNELVNLFFSMASQLDDDSIKNLLHRFFEALIPYMHKPRSVNAWSEWDFDNFKFIAHELFLYSIASLIKYRRFEVGRYLLAQPYYYENNDDRKNPMVPFTIFFNYLRSLEHRNQRLNLRRVSLQADLLIQRNKGTGISQTQLLQADFAAFIRDAFDALKSKTRQRWQPVTLVYKNEDAAPFEIFARAQSKEYFGLMSILFDVRSPEEFIGLCKAFNDGTLWIPKGHFGPILNPNEVMDIDRLATLA